MVLPLARRAFIRYAHPSSKQISSSRLFSTSAVHKQSAQPQPRDASEPGESETSFGFRTIPSSEKESRVGEVFTSVAASYDRMNDLMSLGVHRLWKDYFVRSLNPGNRSASDDEEVTREPQTVLDVAGGTGDIALRILDHMTKVNHDTKSRVIVSDINGAMLGEGQKRLSSTPYARQGRMSYLEANAETFPTIAANSIDLYTVAFGIRNFTSIPAALATAHRILKPGGVFACLEFSHVDNTLLNSVYKRWSFGAIPLIGQLVAGDRESYQYLVESIEKFPTQQAFQDMIQHAGFLIPSEDGAQRKGWVNLTGGVAAIHKGIKPASST